jgi:hypothetical protein
MLRMTVRSDPIFTNSQEILAQILTVLKQKEKLSWNLSGKYVFTVTREVIEMIEAESKVIVNLSYNYQIAKGSSDNCNLNKDYVKVLHKRLCSSIGTIATGFTKATITSTLGEHTQFYADPCFQGQQWYDWALVHFQEVNKQTENHYPSKILGFLAIDRKRDCDTVFHKTTSLECIGKNFDVKMKLGMDFNISFVTVPIEGLVHPLCVITDSGGDRDMRGHQQCTIAR